MKTPMRPVSSTGIRKFADGILENVSKIKQRLVESIWEDFTQGWVKAKLWSGRMSPLEHCDLRKLSQHLCILLSTAEPHRICCVLQPLLIESLLQSVLWASQVAQRERICLPMQETRSLTPVGQIPLEKEMIIHSCILTWEIPWTEEPGRLQSMGSQRIWHTWATEHAWRSNSHNFLVVVITEI